jgi:N-acetylglucosamine kinase-like BadF-type ATPase
MGQDMAVLSVDLGKTSCRLRFQSGGTTEARRGPGFGGLHAADGAEAAICALAPLVTDLATDHDLGLVLVGIGAAGADTAPHAARIVAEAVKARWGATVAIGSDVLTAHAGAFAGEPGTLVVAGTGAVAYRVDDRGHRMRADGWGPWLGDEGSGRWIGQSGLTAVLRAADGRGPDTALTEDAEREFGDLARLPSAIGAGADTPRRLAAFAPRVLDRADDDPVAARIVGDAIRHLVAAVAAVAADGEVAVMGGLGEHSGFRDALDAALAARGFVPRRPAGSALDGASALVRGRAPLHERYATRV